MVINKVCNVTKLADFRVFYSRKILFGVSSPYLNFTQDTANRQLL